MSFSRYINKAMSEKVLNYYNNSVFSQRGKTGPKENNDFEFLHIRKTPARISQNSLAQQRKSIN